ncbi:MAG TPA: AMP-binding protein, partial [Thermoanaerobaculia bacterium]|nr:AMP-binding protein [Thermoanaerobaculia bacterium]
MSLVDAFREQSEHRPEKVLFTYLRGGERRGLELTAAELERRARRLAGWLQELAQPGDRVLLRYPTGPDFVIALVACLYAEVIAVPVAGDGDTARHILEDSGAALVLTAEPRAAAGRAAPPAPPIPTFDTRDGPPAAAGEWRPRHSPADRVAYLQYTSGSVSAPRGVMVTHANVLHNLQAIDADFRHDDASVIQSWLPHYHDMGLIYGVLQTVVRGTRCVVMSPGAFVQRPLRWLRAISEHGCTHSGGPNFAYEMCARRVTAEDLASLDLRRWRVAFNGAEPVRSATLRRFAASFGACGFDAGAIHPAYGLAEATLKVTGRPHAGAWRETAFDTAALASRRAIAASTASAASTGAGAAEPTLLVSCGRPVGDTAVQVVDPVSRRAVGQGEMGEVWVSGPSVAAGYWNRPEASREVFAARCQDREGDHLRTGDLGFLYDGELYLAGRLKDIVIVRGRNLFPQDLEALSSQAHPILNRTAVAAFGVGGDEGSEEVVIVQEVVRRAIDRPPAVLAAAIAAIRRAVIERFQVRARIVLAGPSSVPKTSSGKPRRQACRERWLAGRLAAMLMDSASLPVSAAETSGSTVASLLHGGEWGDMEVALLAWLRQEVGGLSEPPAPEAPLDAALPQLGIDSVRCLQLSSRIQATAAAEIGVGELLAAADVGAIWQCILERQSPAAREHLGHAAGAPAAAIPAPLSHAQQAQWLLAELAGAGPTRNISAVIGLAGELSPEVLARCLAEIVRRHEILRTRYDDPPAAGPPGAAAPPPGPLQQVDPPPASVPMAAVAVAGEEELRELARREAARAFDLRRGPVLHLCLARLGSGRHALVVTLHHIAADGPSVSLLVRELAELYAAHLQGREPRLPALTVQYGDYARWQRQDSTADGPPGTGRAYWRDRLAGLDQAPAGTRGGLPAARPGAGEEHRFELGPEPWRRLRQLGRETGTTPFMVLLAGFAALRQRYTGGGEVVVGAPIDQRRRPELTSLIGLFMNLLPYRVDLGREPSVRELLRRVRETALAAYAHQDVPPAEAVRALGGAVPPVAWTLSVHPDPPALASAGVRFSVDEIHVTLAEFELELHLWGCGESLQGLIFYRTGAWEERAAARLATHYCNLLRALAADAGQPVWRLGMLSEAERAQLLAGAAVAGAAPARTLCELFEAQAARRPQATALSCDELCLSYGELNRRANRLGRRLRQLGIDVDGRVGVCLERSAELVVAILGVLKAGAAYVPLEPANPVERLAAMIAGAGVTVVVTTAALRQRVQAAAGGAPLLALDEQRESLAPPGADPAPLDGAYPEPLDGAYPEPLDGANPPPRAQPGSLAYVIHTSGSTGRPKGVMVTHANVARLFTTTEPWYGFGCDDVWLLFHSYAFDFSVWEMWGALLYGGRLAVMPAWGVGLPATLSEVVRREAVTV